MASQSDEEFILELSKTTEASPKRDLLKKHNGNHKPVRKEARKIKAES